MRSDSKSVIIVEVSIQQRSITIATESRVDVVYETYLEVIDLKKGLWI